LGLKARLLDVKRSLKFRKNRKSQKTNYIPRWASSHFKDSNAFIEREIARGLQCVPVHKAKKRKVLIKLPKKMNFDTDYDTTVRHINAIIHLVKLTQKHKGKMLPKTAYELAGVNFDELEEISTPAALVLTSEVSNWEDSTRRKLVPQVKCWNDDIFQQLNDLGFFDLFDNKPNKKCCSTHISEKKLVKYKKGICGEKGVTKALKNDVASIVGEKVKQWTFLHSGLDEAITNVSHHAYPNPTATRTLKKTWFVTGSYHETKKELKIAFYDQGVGIPKTLPSSKIKEKVVEFLDRFPSAERKKDEMLLKAAVEIDRTSTGNNDRGKGLQDLLEFIKQRQNGRLSIISGRGSYSYIVDNGNETNRTFHSKLPVHGTLIIWSVIL
tara:strand:- start:1774 stop:2919 length:1146 start_codon:yes stop_codon:yes gene_type:complete